MPPGKIDVVPLGLGRPAPPRRRPRRSCGERLALGDRPLILSLSAKRPHKNLRGLIDAVARIPAERRPVLVLPGYPTPHEAELRERARGARDRRRRAASWAGRATPDLEGLFALSSAFVFPSFYEGFGLPVLEAMARGIPVACSDRASLPEVAGDAALPSTPRTRGAIAAAIQRLLGDAELAASCAPPVRAGRAFTWKRAARLTLTSYGPGAGPAGARYHRHALPTQPSCTRSPFSFGAPRLPVVSTLAGTTSTAARRPDATGD